MRERRLRTWLMLLLVATASLTFTIIGCVILVYRLPQLEELRLASLQERAITTSLLLDHVTSGIEAELAPLARLARTQPPAELKAVADAVVGDGDVFEAVFVVAADGRVQTLSLPPRHQQAASELRGADFSGSRLFRSASAAAPPDGRIRAIWSDKYLSTLSGKTTVGVALTAGRHLIIGETSTERILAMLKATAPNADAVVTIVDRNGQWLASSLPDPDPPDRFADFRTRPWFRDVVEGRVPSGSERHRGERRLTGGVLSDKLRWVIAVTAPAGWSDQAYRVTVLLVVGGFVGALLISAGLAPFWAARMAQPLHGLIARTHAASEGDYRSPWPPRGIVSELNQLAADLERMVAVIREREQETARSEERLRATLESTPSVAVQWYAPDGRVLYWNQASELLYGYTAAEAVGTNVARSQLMFRSPAQAAEYAALLAEIGRTGQPAGPAEYPLRHKGGSEIVVLATTFAIPGDDGGRILVCMDVDVTARRRAAAALLESEQKLEAIFNASPAAMSVSDPQNDYRYIAVNAAWERQFRRDRAAVLGRSGRELGLWAGEQDRQRFRDLVANRVAVVDMEAMLLTGDGTPMLCRISTSIVPIEGHELLLTMADDITEERRIEGEIRALNSELERRVEERTLALSDANDELAATIEHLKATQEQLVQVEKLAALGTLVAGIAHELNTPIGNGLMAVTTLRDRLQEFRADSAGGLRRSAFDALFAAFETGSDIAARNLRRAAELIAGFKQVAVDQTSSQRRRFALREVVDEILLTLIPTLRRTPFKVDKAIPEDLLLDSYPGPLGQALANLVNNAVLHAFDGREQGSIRITASGMPGGRIAIRVRDDGCGIPTDQQARVFEPFFTTRMGRGGTGLGLHLVHGIVTNVLGGTIAVESRVGEGTEFTLVLPVNAPVANPPSAPA